MEDQESRLIRGGFLWGGDPDMQICLATIPLSGEEIKSWRLLQKVMDKSRWAIEHWKGRAVDSIGWGPKIGQAPYYGNTGGEASGIEPPY